MIYLKLELSGLKSAIKPYRTTGLGLNLDDL